MQLPLLTHDEIVENSAAAVRAECPQLTDLTPGGPLRAILEADAHNTQWAQYRAILLLGAQRLATCVGEDVDSFIAQFGLTRNTAIAATGMVSFGRNTFGTSVSVPVGTTLKTAEGIEYEVILDPGSPRYNPRTNSYILAGNVTEIDVPVEAFSFGIGGNVVANTITQITSALPGIDYATNKLAFTNGAEAESDDAVRDRFRKFIDTRHLGTLEAVKFATISAIPGITCTIEENVLPDLSPQYGHFIVRVSDGSGNQPSSSLISTLYNAINVVRPICTTFSVLGPTFRNVSVSFTLSVLPGYIKLNVASEIQLSVAAYINALGMGKALSFFALAKHIQDVEGVSSIAGLTVNNATLDVGGESNIALRATNINVL